MASDGEYTDSNIPLARSSATKPSKPPEKIYPTIYLSDLSKSNPLVAKDVGETCNADVMFKIQSKSQNSDGKWSVTLEVRDMSTKRSGC